MLNRPVIGITMGDASGVGPEIVMKCFEHREVYDTMRPQVIGDRRRVEHAGRLVGSTLIVKDIALPGEARYLPGTVDCIDLGLIPADLPFGRLSAIARDAAYRYIARAVELASAGQLDAICTASLNKEAMHAGGHKYPGHTELLAELTGTSAMRGDFDLVG